MPEFAGGAEIAVVEEGFRAAGREMGLFNLAVFGLTGAGKSTLVNTVFGRPVAATGIGVPVTQGSRLYRRAGSPMGIYDTKGLEIGSDSGEILAELGRFIEANRAGDVADQIHVIWYCIRSGDRRLQPAEADFVRHAAGLGIPVLLVLTQTPLLPTGALHPDAVALRDFIAALGLPVRGDAVCVNALGDPFDGVEPFGLEGLLDATARAAPDGVRSALAAAQVISARQKHGQAQLRIDAVAAGLHRKAILPDVGRAWSELFAEIAAIYQLPAADARAVLDRVRTARQLRTLVRRADTGLIVLAAGALTAVGIPLEGRGLRMPAEESAPRSGDVPLAYPADAEAPAAVIGPVLAAEPVTHALGEAWRETCEHYWLEAFPEPPVGVDPAAMADRFAGELFARLPKRLQRWEERQRRLAAERGPAPAPYPAPAAAPAGTGASVPYPVRPGGAAAGPLSRLAGRLRGPRPRRPPRG